MRRPDAACLRDVRQICVGRQIGWSGVSESPGQGKVIIRFIRCLSVHCLGEGLRKQWPLPALLREGCPLALTVLPDTQFLPISPWCLSSSCHSTGAQSESKFIPLRGTPGAPAALPSQPQSLLIFVAGCYGDFSSWHWKPGLRACFGDGTPHYSGGSSAAKVSLLLNHQRWVWDQCIPILPVSMWFLYNLSCRTSV